LAGLREEADEYDLDFTDESIKVTNIKKLEKFSPKGVDADFMLVSSSHGQLFLVGVYKDEENDFYQLELTFTGSDKFNDVTETCDELILTTTD